MPCPVPKVVACSCPAGRRRRLEIRHHAQYAAAMADDVNDSSAPGAQLPHQNESGGHTPADDAGQEQDASAEAHDRGAPASGSASGSDEGTASMDSSGSGQADRKGVV